MTAIDYERDMYYRRSGHAPFAGTTLAAIVSWIVIIALAGMYAYADLYIKVVDKLSVVITLAFAAGMGFAVYAVLRWGQVRSMPVAFVISLSCAALAVYASWVVWEYAILEREGVKVNMWQLASRPKAVYHFAMAMNEVGTFSMKRGPVKGGELMGFWIAEGVGIFLATLIIPLVALSKLAFCESCRAWCAKHDGSMRVAYGDEDALRRAMEAKDFSHLAKLGPAHSDTPVHFRIDLYDCPKCAEMNLMTINRAKVSYDSKNNRQESLAKVVDRMYMGEAQVNELRQMPHQWLAALQAAQAANAPADGTSSTTAASADVSSAEQPKAT